jgi:hypothetical protein
VEARDLRRPGLHVTTVDEPGAGIYVLELGDAVHVRVPRARRAQIERLTSESALDARWWRAGLRDADAVVLGPARHYLGGVADRPSAQVVHPTVAELEELAEQVSPDELEESGVSEPDVLLFGVWEHEALVAVSSLSRWAGGHTDVGVLVAPASRGRGLGFAAATMAVSAATGQAGIVRWRCREDNAASVALANRLGLTFYARNLGIRL